MKSEIKKIQRASKCCAQIAVHYFIYCWFLYTSLSLCYALSISSVSKENVNAVAHIRRSSDGELVAYGSNLVPMSKRDLGNSVLVGKEPGGTMASDKGAKTLMLTQILFRHGDRSPIHSYPNDPHKNDWPQGLGQLTKIGMNQAYQLGLYLQQRYQTFLSSTYKHEEVHIRSTYTDRTLMTAECVAAGLFPLNQSATDDSTTLQWPLGAWQPVPIETVPFDDDRVLHPAHSCEYTSDLSSEAQAMYATDKKMINEESLMLKLSHDTGMTINVTSLHQLADTIYCQKSNNMSQPEWMTPEIEDKLMNYRAYRPVISAEDAKYLSGTLLDTLIKNMLQKANSQSDPHKIHLYSAHDSTVGPLLALLEADNHLQVPYTAAVIVELHLIKGEHFVQVLYRNDTTGPPRILVPKRCRLSPCPLSVFHGMYKDHILTDEEWLEICEESSGGITSVNDNMIPILVAVIVALIGLNGFLVFKACSLSKQVRQAPHQEQYALLQTTADDSGSDSESELTTVNNNENRGPNGPSFMDHYAADEGE